MFEKVNQIARLFEENKEAEAALKNAKTVDEAVAILGQYGINVTAEEFVQIGKELTSDELSEEMLALVSGGGWGRKVWGAVKDFFHGFLDAF